MADEIPRKGFWASLTETWAQSREERERKRKERNEEIFRGLAALAVISGKLPEDIDKALGPEGRCFLPMISSNLALLRKSSQS